MSVDTVRAYLETFGLADRLRQYAESCATVESAAAVVGVESGRIVKTLSFKGKDEPDGPRCILIAASGDARIDGKKFKDTFGIKSKMLAPEEAEAMTGHAVGGVCPFALEGRPARLYLDESLRRFPVVYPAGGSCNAMVEIGVEELFRVSGAAGWVDVCK